MLGETLIMFATLFWVLASLIKIYLGKQAYMVGSKYQRIQCVVVEQKGAKM